MIEKIKEIEDAITKKWYKSKTLIFNTAVVGLVTLEQNLGYIKEIFNMDIFVIISVVVPMVNFYLRTITTEAIKKIKGQ